MIVEQFLNVLLNWANILLKIFAFIFISDGGLWFSISMCTVFTVLWPYCYDCILKKSLELPLLSGLHVLKDEQKIAKGRIPVGMKEGDYTEGTSVRHPGGYVQRTPSLRPLHTKPATFSHSTASACSEAAEYNCFSYVSITIISCISSFFLLRRNHEILCLPQRRSSSTPETHWYIKN